MRIRRERASWYYSGVARYGHSMAHAVLVVSVLITNTFAAHVSAAPYAATTTVSLTVCGDSIVSGAELCDDGTNTGAYATAIATRQCNPLCSAYGPYCGDSIIQVFNGEECDDGNNTAGDLCDASCQNESDPVTEGGGSGGGNPGGGGGKGSGNNAIPGASTEGNIPFNGDTEVVIRGKAYPGATVTILMDGAVERVIEAGSDATFEYLITEATPGTATFGFWALDRAGRRSITYASTFQVIENAITTLSGILLPPTLAVVPEKVAPGATVSFEGSAVPQAKVTTDIDDTAQKEETVAGSDGAWAIVYDTKPLSAEAFHKVKANYIDPEKASLVSGYSQIASFYVGVNDVKTGQGADLNGDGLVNLTDFSILLFNWNTANAIADINKDGTVSLPDFSILLFHWTG